jgi:anti-anti-sigma factor
MEVSVEQDEGAVVCRVDGTLDSASVAEFRISLSQLPTAKHVVIDLSGVPFVDSAGFGALIGAIRRIRETGRDVALCAPRPSVRRALRLVGLDRIVNIADNRSEIGEDDCWTKHLQGGPTAG